MSRDSLPGQTTVGIEPGGVMTAHIPTIGKGPIDYPPSPKPAWTFFTNHAHVLLCIAQQPGMRMREVAQFVGVTERCVQRILGELEEAGYVTRVRRGRRNYYEIHADLPLRHPAEQHRQVSALLDLVLSGQDRDGDREEA